MANTLKFGNGEWYGKKDTILAYNDENNNYKPLPFDFSRASSATRVNKDGLIETVGSGEPRIDFLGNTKGALLLEPSRSNVITYSQDFSNWFQIGSPTITSNYGVSPDGTQNSSRLQMNTSSKIYITVASSGDISFTVYLKGVGQVRLRDNTSTGLKDVTLTSEWVRYELNFNATISNFQIEQQTGVSDFEIYGAQLEEGSYATSYIPTSGSAVTRIADSCSQTTPSGVIGQTEGTLLIDIDIDNNSSDFVNFFLWNGTTSNRVFIQRRGNNKFIQCQMSKSGETTVDFSGNTIIGIGRHKMAVSYSNSRLVAYIDGNKVGEESTGFSYTNQLTKIGLTENSALRILKEVKLYNNSMTDKELIALTS